SSAPRATSTSWSMARSRCATAGRPIRIRASCCAMALDASRLLTPEQVQRLRGKSGLVGALLMLHAWGLIFASMALFVAWPNPLSFVVAVMVIGARQLGLAILMHDAAHGLLFDDRRLNE